MDSEAEFANEESYYSQQSPEYLLINIEFGEQIELAISTLSKELRICYTMHLFGGHTYEDIAKKMHCPIWHRNVLVFLEPEKS